MPLPIPGSSRLRSTSSPFNTTQEHPELASLIKTLKNVEFTAFDDLVNKLLSPLQELRHVLKDNGDTKDVRDAFRRLEGLQTLLTVFDKAANGSGTSMSTEHIQSLLDLSAQILVALGAALEDHPGNQKYFRTKIEGGGWARVQNDLSAILDAVKPSSTNGLGLERLFGLLFATAVGAEMVSDTFIVAHKAFGNSFGITNEPESEVVDAIRTHIDARMVGLEGIALPEFLTIVAILWQKYTSDPDILTKPLNVALPLGVNAVLAISRHNVVAAHTAGLLTASLPLLFEPEGSTTERILFREIVLLLCREGVSSLEDAQTLFRRAACSTSAASFLLEALRLSSQPPSIQFDLSLHGYASLEISTLGKQFPPFSSAGYTLAFWIKFDHFDPNAHTTIFGAFDRTQTCFLLTYLEKDTGHLILQTAVRGPRPSVRFKSVAFQADKWYHICLVHRRPRTISSSRASLFVDGEFVEQTKATYPTEAPVERSNGGPKIQAFLGTPHDLSPQSPGGVCLSKWSLASAVLFQEALSDDLLVVLYFLGPRYHGNFQDCLGSFQTYQASAALNLRNEALNPGREEQSDLILAIRQKASSLIREDSILLNISPASVLDNDDRNNIDETQLIRSLSKAAAKNLAAYTRMGGNAVAVNGAIPAINDALTQPQGIAILMGEPTVTVPQSLDEASWRLGGCAAVGLGLLHRAKTTEDVALATDILLETIRPSWRNSEVMERDSGYAILSSLLRDKLASVPTVNSDAPKTSVAIPTPSLDRNGLALRALKSILSFLGYDFNEPSKSILNNPLAYKVLLVDTNIWRTGSPAVQELYFNQFIDFAEGSRHKRFNVKRLARMRASKRLLEALKSEPVTSTTIALYMKVFKVLLPSAMSAEMLRSFALFVTFSVHKRNAPLQARKTLRREPRPRHPSNAAASKDDASVHLTHFEIGVEILRLYSDLLCQARDDLLIKRFAKTVTNKWLLYLLSETSPEVVVLSMKILARLLVVHGDAYVKKFGDKSGGFTILAHRLRRWWHLPALWPACFAVLFDVDVASLELERSFDLFGFIDLFSSRKEFAVAHPEMFEPIVAMLQTGLKTIISSQERQPMSSLASPLGPEMASTPERLSMSTMAPSNPLLTTVTSQHVETFNTVVQFLADLHSRSQKYREYATSSSYIQDLLSVLFPVVVGSDVVEARVELEARDSTLTFDGGDIVVQPLSTVSPIVRTTHVEAPPMLGKGKNLRRGSSFVLVTREQARQQSTISHLHKLVTPVSPLAKIPALNDRHAIVQSILEMVIAIFSDQMLAKKDFPGLGLYLRTPPGFVEHQSYFESWILRNTISQVSTNIALNQEILCEPRILTNLARFFSHLGEALFEGWFIGGADAVLDLSGSVLEFLQRQDIAKQKSVRLCSQATTAIRAVVFRTVLLSLSQVQNADSVAFLDKLTYWQTVLLSSEDTESGYLQLVCYLLYASLISDQEAVRSSAVNLWRIIFVQKPKEAAAIFGLADNLEQKRLVTSFEKLVELDNDTFLYWLDKHREELDSLFFDTLSKLWDAFVTEENHKTEENARSRIARRREKLKQWTRDEADREDLIRRHEVTFDHWTANIFTSEYLKHQRLLQDQQDDLVFTSTTFARMERDTGCNVGIFPELQAQKWRLDQTEGRNRMRMRLTSDTTKPQDSHQPRRKGLDMPSLRLDTNGVRMSTMESIGITPGGAGSALESPNKLGTHTEPFPEVQEKGDAAENGEVEESFELVRDPAADLEEFEDKNRKVMRSLHRGDQVKQVANISRIVGLEAAEGLLILGKDNIYIIDNFFQRADGEIVSVWQAPDDERDSYVRMISGRDVKNRKPFDQNEEHETRSWKWTDVISVSKRRFLFRDVAIEIFFGDGRSYLLTVLSPTARNDLYTTVTSKAPQYGSSNGPQSEIAWRYETLKSADEEPQTFGSRFANVFSQSGSMSATRKWQKGELSNFHYLMLVNTMAGRTYNDLTQYPVFPWVIADYTSDELDLSDPRSFRDFSKPMGCQTPEREAEFRERYKSFAEMGDQNSPPFHYGTHYSSAMIVTSYLIRLQPFVKSYLLLQGGTFDHPDRMFFSVEQAWRSASRTNMTDVRELTPEFFYLPEFLVNLNEFDFGTRQANNKSISSVELPPWSKGDPRIFIAKQREALESPHVSKHLHKWIDLVFGCKQKGEAALEAVNVFHHLSYQGAKDLDNIMDPVERLATIGIIHNFGQTPYQVFQKAHLAREHARHKYKRLDTAAESLTRLPSYLLEGEERVASLTYSWKSDRLLCSGAFRLNIPPLFDKYMEWGFSDCSVRFYSAESRKLIGHFEHLHVGQLAGALFADSKTLVTSGTDCTVAVWSLLGSHKSVDLQTKKTLFGHRKPASVLSISRSFNALLSASRDGEIILWDLSRGEYVRNIDTRLEVECACINDVTGDIVLCHGSQISIYTLNGDLILSQDTGDRFGDSILSCACYEGAGSEWLERDILFTGHKRGVVRVWSKVIRDGRFEVELVRQLNHVDNSREDGANVSAGISCILPMPQVVYTGDEDGRVVSIISTPRGHSD